MQTWAKRGLQTALVTGGLLMLGTGIASADEDVNPDKPASALDGSLTVPVHIDNNAIGTPLGQADIPGVHHDVEVSPADVVGQVPGADQAAAAQPMVEDVQQAAAPVAEAAAPVTEQAQPLVGQTAPLAERSAVPGMLGSDPLLGNRVSGDVVAPIDISGNAIALLGHAEVENNASSQSASHETSVETSGSGGFLAGNVVDLDWALPVQITNNAVAGLGSASASGTSSQDASATGDIDTDGSSSFLGGNVLAGQAATPIQADGNAIAGGGWATADSQANSEATAGGSILTSGADSLGGGNAGAVPVAVPLKANGNSLAGAGEADATADSSADATAGATREGMYGLPTYMETNGDPAAAAGNIAQAPISGPALLCGNAGAAVGGSTADCATDSETTAGGISRTTGQGSVASGSIATTPVALPAESFGNAVAGVGTADAIADNTADATAGGDSYTRGHESLLSGTTASSPVSGPADVFANSVAGVGDADSTAVQDVTAISGGNTGTTGDDSLGGGNMITSPIATPVETFGNVAAGAGGATATAAETKVSSAGGGSNTDDDNGVGASNLVTTPVAGAAQAFGNGAGLVAFTDAKATNDAEVTAGGPAKATGTAGLLSGNIGQGALSLPLQLFGTGASGLANGEQAAVNQTDLTSGGDATSDGAGGAGSGNVANVPLAGAGQVYGDSAAALGLNESLAGSETSSTAGGDTETSGQSGLVSGNVASPQGLGLAQGFGDAASGVGGLNSALATNKTDATSGGDIDTTGDEGFLSGNLADVPAAAVVQPFGDAVSAVASNSFGSGFSDTEGDVGGTSTTSGELAALSGIDGTLPLGANAPVYDVPVEVLAQAVTDSANTSDISVGEGEPQLNLPVTGGMSPTELPTLTGGQRSMPADPFAGVFSGVLDGFAGGMTGLPGQDVVTDLTASTGTLTEAPGEFHILPAPYPMGRAAAADPLPGLPGLPGDLLGGGAVPGLDLLGGVTGGDALGGVTGGFAGGRTLPTDFPPAVGDLTDVTTVIPAVPAAPGVPAVPGVGDVTDVPVVQAPSLDRLPVTTPELSGVQAPGLSDVDAPLNTSSLDATRAALANLFAQHPIG